MASEVGSGQVAIFPVYTGFRKSVVSEVSATTSAAAQTFQRGFGRGAATAGTSAGKGFQASFTDATRGVGEVTLKKFQGDVANATKAMASNLLRVQDAQGKVRVATAQLDEATTKWGSDSSRTIAAQERLATATRNLGAIQDRQSSLTTTLRAAQQQLASAQDLASRSAVNALSSYGLFGRGLQTVFDGVRGGVNLAAGALSTVAAGIGRAFSSGIQLAVSTVQDGLQVVKNLATGAAAAAAVGISAVISKGFKRLTGIETAQAKLTAIGLTAKDVAQVMADANDAVIGTQYSLADAVTAASSAVAAGIKPGKQLNDYLKTTVNAAALAGVNLGDLGLVMNQVQAQNKAYTQDLNQVASRGIPIYAGLAQVYGVTQAKLRDMLQSGSIDAAHFQAALKLVAGNAALSIGQTTVGAFDNLGAAAARLGAGFLSGVFPVFREFFITMTRGLDAITPGVAAFSQAIGPKLQAAVGNTLDRISTAFGHIKDALSNVDPRNVLGNLAGNFSLLAPVIGAVLGAFGPLLAKLPLVGTLFSGITLPLGLVVGAFVAVLRASKPLRDALNNLGTEFGKVISSSFGPGGSGTMLLQQLNAVFHDLAKTIGESLAIAIEQITPLLPQLFDAFVQIVKAVVPLIPQLLSLLPSIVALLPPLVQLAVEVLPLLVPLLDSLVKTIGFLIPVVDFIVQSFGAAVVAINGLFAVFSGDAPIASLITNLVNLGGPIGAVESWFANLGISWFRTLFQIGDITQRTFGQIIGFFGALPGQINAVFAGAATWLVKAGHDMIAGLLNGVTDAAKGIGSFFANIGKDALNGIKGALGIHSPSRVFRMEVGRPIGDGAILGVKDRAAELKATVASMITATSGVSAATVASSSASAAQGVGSGNVYIDKIVAPDQNPVVSGRIMGREFLRQMAGTPARS